MRHPRIHWLIWLGWVCFGSAAPAAEPARSHIRYDSYEGLVMAEVELEYDDEPFEKPDFIGAEVTGDRRYYNSQLKAHPFTTWKE